MVQGVPKGKICGAKARSNGHKPCRKPAMENGRCRFHGGLTPKIVTLPKTEEARLRQKMGSWKHGLRSKEAIEEQRALSRMMREAREFLRSI